MDLWVLRGVIRIYSEFGAVGLVEMHFEVEIAIELGNKMGIEGIDFSSSVVEIQSIHLIGRRMLAEISAYTLTLSIYLVLV